MEAATPRVIRKRLQKAGGGPRPDPGQEPLAAGPQAAVLWFGRHIGHRLVVGAALVGLARVHPLVHSPARRERAVLLPGPDRRSRLVALLLPQLAGEQQPVLLRLVAELGDEQRRAGRSGLLLGAGVGEL